MTYPILAESIENAELARCWAKVWKIIAKEYRQEARQLSIALDHAQQNCDLIFDELKTERDLARQYAGELEDALQVATRSVAAAEQRADALRRALWQFGDLLRKCSTRRAPGTVCDCGFQQALDIGKGQSR